MEFNVGDHIYCRLLPEMITFSATVVSSDSGIIVLRADQNAPVRIDTGRNLTISMSECDIDEYVELVEQNERVFRVKQKWTGRREYFRVSDVFPLSARIIADEQTSRKSSIFPWYSMQIPNADEIDETINPRLWKMLTEINTKLNMILTHIEGKPEEFGSIKRRAVNISACGVRFTADERYEAGSLLELKLILPLDPPVGIVTYGSVVRVEEQKPGIYETAVHFIDLEPDVEDIIIQYTLKRQRELIRRRNPRRDEL